ncbi:lipocalin family protein [bacterium]|nr:lipocalin family protein [bacterium]
MLKFLLICLIIGSTLLVSGKEPLPVANVDLIQYQGTWYEIAKLPNWFQKKCVKNTTASYQLKEDGHISVINRCVEKDGDINSVEGMARIVDPKTNAKLEVSFARFLWSNWFWGAYWVIGLADDYSWAIVGGPNHKYAWILAREKKLDDSTLDQIFGILKDQGYDPNKFEFTVQD